MSNHAIFDSFKPVVSTTSGVHVYDFVGAATRVSFKRAWAKHAIPAGRSVTPAMPPKNEHYLDWIAVLRAVDAAKGTFRMAELGAGWAPWLVRAALAARQKPAIDAVELVGVEADPFHYQWMREHFADNGLDPDSHQLLHGAAGPHPGTVRFPVIAEPDVDYGASTRHANAAAASIEVRSWTVAELLALFTGPVDFLHVDIQGGEYECLPPAMDLLVKNVRQIMVGTHMSAELHNGLASGFRAAGWREVMNLPRNGTSDTPWGQIATTDGFLLFENPQEPGR